MTETTRLDTHAESPEAARPAMAVDKHLFESRQVLIVGEISMDLAKSVCQRLLALAQASDDPITVMVSSPGGHVESGDMIHDMIQFIKPKVNIVGSGWVASAGALIYVAVPKERRFCTANTRFLLHQPSGGAGGQASDIEIQAREIVKMKERLNKIFAAATGQPLEKVEKDTDRDYWMSPDEAIEYGLVGKVVSSAGDVG
ncbi:MAG: ATP-dependent Clp protease proteolytic subunit [Pseudomonadota bacterium]